MIFHNFSNKTNGQSCEKNQWRQIFRHRRSTLFGIQSNLILNQNIDWHILFRRLPLTCMLIFNEDAKPNACTSRKVIIEFSSPLVWSHPILNLKSKYLKNLLFNYKPCFIWLAKPLTNNISNNT
jgi:hypothetical protein